MCNNAEMKIKMNRREEKALWERSTIMCSIAGSVCYYAISRVKSCQRGRDFSRRRQHRIHLIKPELRPEVHGPVLPNNSISRCLCCSDLGKCRCAFAISRLTLGLCIHRLLATHHNWCRV